jgi:hypothetical protein
MGSSFRGGNSPSCELPAANSDKSVPIPGQIYPTPLTVAAVTQICPTGRLPTPYCPLRQDVSSPAFRRNRGGNKSARWLGTQELQNHRCPKVRLHLVSTIAKLAFRRNRGRTSLLSG